MSSYNDDSNPVLTLIMYGVILFGCFMFVMCSNSCIDEDMKKISLTTKEEYLAHNTESWGNKLVGGDRMKKSIYATYTAIAKENNTSVYEAIKDARGRFAGQFKNKFRTFGSFTSLPNIRNAYRMEDNGEICVIVHFTWQECSGSGENHHCWTEHDEVIIPEIIQPKKYEYQEPEEVYEYEEPPMQKGVGIEYEGVDITNY